MHSHLPYKVAVVTGGAQGIGKAISLKLMEERYTVVIVDIDQEAGHEIMQCYGKVFDVEFVHADISGWESVEQLMHHISDKYGRLDGLVNNAADADPYNVPVEKLEQGDWQQKININLGGAVACVRYSAHLLKASEGSVVNIASTRALMSEPDSEAYVASKGGIIALTHALANSLGPKVRVNAISPGWIEVSNWQKTSEQEEPELREIDHRQHPAGRVGRPEDIAGMTALLLSKRAGFITGQNFIIDGGMTRKMIYAE